MTKNVLEKSRKYQHTRRHIEEQRRRVLLWFGGLVALVLLLVAAGLVWEYLLVPRKVVARVNGEPIYVRDFQAQVRFQRTLLIRRISSYIMFYQQFQSLGLPMDPQVQAWARLLDDPETLGRQVLEEMIDNALIRQEMERRGLRVTDEEVDKAIREAFGLYEDGTPTPTPSLTPPPTSTLSPTQIALLTPKVTATPTAGPSPTPTPEATATSEPSPTPAEEGTPPPTPTPYTEQAFQEDLQAFLKETGLSMNDLRRIFRDYLYRDKFIQELAKTVAREEEQVWVRHILIKDEETAKEVLERLQKGEDWHLLAQNYSEDLGSAQQGGDIGWIARGDTVPEFEAMAFSLEVGEISGLVGTQYGWHILQVLGKEKRPLSEQQYQRRLQEALQQWLQEARTKADIEIYDEVWKAYVPAEPELPPQIRLLLAPPTPALKPITVAPPTPQTTPQP